MPDSRCVVQRRFLIELTERAVAIELDAALDKCGGAKARIVHDHGSELSSMTANCAPSSKRTICSTSAYRDDYYGDNYLQTERATTRLIDEYQPRPTARSARASGAMRAVLWESKTETAAETTET